ncbi:amidohydrolase 2 [Mrakia frigida]|uniref:amidohydrolase family protein n=1 Tax=Mrakia frigida TaxID=29902 RepID=UPI003FCBF426
MSLRPLLVDVHSHVYLPGYAKILRNRTSAPRILTRTGPDGKPDDRLLILDNESAAVGGRPVGPQYWDRSEKLGFMNTHGIDVSLVSTANPWLDFLTPSEALKAASELNSDLQDYCAHPINTPLPTDTNALRPTSFKPLTDNRLFGLGLLPLVPGVAVKSVLETIKELGAMDKMKGVIMGSRGMGSGLDDPEMEEVWGALAREGLVTFLHPHYGIGNEEMNYGSNVENGHVLQLATGFPFETTLAITRLILSGAFDRHPDLKILLAHSGGALGQLSSRLASCVEHDPIVQNRLKHDPRYYLSKLWFDAVAYGSEELEFVGKVAGRSAEYEGKSGRGVVAQRKTGATKEGIERMMFGTDHPFFPPLSEEVKDLPWESVVQNLEAIEGAEGWDEKDKAGVKGGNAVRLFGLDV